MTPLSISRRKLIAALRQTRERRQSHLFVAEGTRCVGELLSTDLVCRTIAVKQSWLDGPDFPLPERVEVMQCTSADMERMSSMSTPPDILAVFEMPQREITGEETAKGIVVALDDVRDPGNLGTIIRACDWFGVTDIFCSETTVDAFNPKVVQSTMGALGRVALHYGDICEMVDAQKVYPEVYGTFLDGDNINRCELPSKAAVIVMGNEAHGIGEKAKSIITHKLFIPPFPESRQHVESLNVAMATAITLAAFRR